MINELHRAISQKTNQMSCAHNAAKEAFKMLCENVLKETGVAPKIYFNDVYLSLNDEEMYQQTSADYDFLMNEIAGRANEKLINSMLSGIGSLIAFLSIAQPVQHKRYFDGAIYAY